MPNAKHWIWYWAWLMMYRLPCNMNPTEQAKEECHFCIPQWNEGNEWPWHCNINTVFWTLVRSSFGKVCATFLCRSHFPSICYICLHRIYQTSSTRDFVIQMFHAYMHTKQAWDLKWLTSQEKANELRQPRWISFKCWAHKVQNLDLSLPWVWITLSQSATSRCQTIPQMHHVKYRLRARSSYISLHLHNVLFHCWLVLKRTHEIKVTVCLSQDRMGLL